MLKKHGFENHGCFGTLRRENRATQSVYQNFKKKRDIKG
jgi:hypothetical protein